MLGSEVQFEGPEDERDRCMKALDNSRPAYPSRHQCCPNRGLAARRGCMVETTSTRRKSCFAPIPMIAPRKGALQALGRYICSFPSMRRAIYLRIFEDGWRQTRGNEDLYKRHCPIPMGLGRRMGNMRILSSAFAPKEGWNSFRDADSWTKPCTDFKAIRKPPCTDLEGGYCAIRRWNIRAKERSMLLCAKDTTPVTNQVSCLTSQPRDGLGRTDH